MNPLAQLRAANAASGVQALRLEHGELVASSEPEWTPRSMMAVMDGADAAKWAFMGVGTEEDVEQYVEWIRRKPGHALTPCSSSTTTRTPLLEDRSGYGARDVLR